MSFWIIVSWVAVAVLTAINVVVFLKLKQASDQVMKMAFPNAKNMNEAMAQMQGMFNRMGGPNAKNVDPRLKTAMQMLQNAQKAGKK